MVPSDPFGVPIDVVPMCALVRVLCSHRLKRLEKSDRRVLDRIFLLIHSPPPSPRSVFIYGPSKKSVDVDTAGNLNEAPPRCLSKCVTFPLSGGTKFAQSSSQGEYELPGSEDCACDVYTRSNSFPPSLKLLPALKGSREKHGVASIGKLTVRWAPDVYDPPPTSVSHFLSRSSKKRAARKDKNEKKGHKGKGSSKAMSSKKKQQPRRIPCSPNRCYNLPVVDKPGVGIPQGIGVGSFEIGCPETCGSSYFINSLSRVHYSAAEAL
ncbi:hypothetical protein MLD38_032650 [Melastoma candidum]|uniref:Uncharacterized protein n=1 Tax=Melastoma candidum TaxID=119954 RepID=A0ACB9M6P9_9MYRT|nr:hypothetical protein MLD38_032650 [Melastoma candidum]